MAEFPAQKEGIALTHFIVSNDVERSRRFYASVLGGETVMFQIGGAFGIATPRAPTARCGSACERVVAGRPVGRMVEPRGRLSTRHCRVSRLGDDALRVAIVGELDMAATLKVEPELDRLLARERVRRLELDLAGVAFIDSAGLGGLLSTRERAAGLGIEVRLVDASAPVRRVLDVSGAGSIFTT